MGTLGTLPHLLNLLLGTLGYLISLCLLWMFISNLWITSFNYMDFWITVTHCSLVLAYTPWKGCWLFRTLLQSFCLSLSSTLMSLCCWPSCTGSLNLTSILRFLLWLRELLDKHLLTSVNFYIHISCQASEVMWSEQYWLCIIWGWKLKKGLLQQSRWICLPLSLRAVDSMVSFKKQLKTYLTLVFG